VRRSDSVALTAWRYERALRRVEGPVERLLAEHVATCCLRPFRRAELPDGAGVHWSIDHETVVAFRHNRGRGGQVIVHDITLVRPLRQLLRSRDFTVSHAVA
jgi:hypothetical protein